MKYEIQLWYRNSLYKGVDLEFFDNEEIKSICEAIVAMLAPRQVLIDCEDIHCWFIVSDVPLPQGERYKIRVRPFPMETTLFELLPGENSVEVEVSFSIVCEQEAIEQMQNDF